MLSRSFFANEIKERVYAYISKPLATKINIFGLKEIDLLFDSHTLNFTSILQNYPFETQPMIYETQTHSLLQATEILYLI